MYGPRYHLNLEILNPPDSENIHKITGAMYHSTFRRGPEQLHRVLCVLGLPDVLGIPVLDACRLCERP